MFRRTLCVPTLVFALLVGLHPVANAFGSTTHPEGTVQASPPTTPPPSSDGVTGTDPEPIEPDILEIVSMLSCLS